MKILFTLNHKDPSYFKSIENLGYEVEYINENNFKLTESAKSADIIVCYNPFENLNLRDFPKLKWIQLTSVGVDQVPFDYIEKNNIILTHNKGGYSIPMSEWVVLKALEHLKNSKNIFENQKNRNWNMDFSLKELYGKTIGFIGTGSIAQESAKRFAGFNVELIGLNTNGHSTDYIKNCYSSNQKKFFLSICDIVVLTLPSTNKTFQYLKYNDFQEMKNTSYFINVSRGDNIKESDLLKALDDNLISGAALDVFETEPLPSSSPIWSNNKISISSHNSWISENILTRRFNLIYENLLRYINGNELLYSIDLNKGY